MKKLLSLWMMFCCSSSLAFYYPNASIYLDNGPSTVFYGETLVIPVSLQYFALQGYKQWHFPPGSYLQYVAGRCPSIPSNEGYWGTGICHMKLVIPGNVLGQHISGALRYVVVGSYKGYRWNALFSSPEIHVTVIPHHLSMQNIPEQRATANQPFIFPLKSVVRYYDENQMAGAPAQAIVQPIEQDGLRFDPGSFSIVGTPTQIGIYQFSVAVHNANGTTEPVSLVIRVQANAKDKPRFKPHYSMVSGLPEQKYSMNLMELVEPQPGLWVTNQVSFRVVGNQRNSDWLHIAQDDATHLVGDVPPEVAGQEVEITLVARSNTGGDSDPLIVRIPIAFDSAKKPEFNVFKLEQAAGAKVYEDLAKYIKDPAHDSRLKVVLDKVEPADLNLKLNISASNPTVLEGSIPKDATGKLFQLTLRAHTPIGGSSGAIKVPLQINFDQKKKPFFKSPSPVLPMLYPGESYYYDFVEHNDVFPEYEDVPYEISFDEEFVHPKWLRIENNKLIADAVFEDIEDDVLIRLVIKNTPGGKSEVYSLKLKVMN